MVLKRERIFVGDKEFFIKELTCLKRNALLDIISQFSLKDIIKSVLPMLNSLSSNSGSSQIGELIELALRDEGVWSCLVACLIDVLHVGPQVILLSLENNLDKETETYVSENLTMSQEPIILGQIIEINRLPDTLKNYKSLLTKVKGMTRN